MKKGFALIYTLLFITLLLIAVSATWLTGMADLRLSQRSSNSVQAYQLAQAGIESGYVKYKQLLDSDTNTLNQTFPTTNACTNGPNGFPVHRLKIADDGTISENDTSFTKTSVNLALNGVYDYRVCNTTIYGIGYYKGSKISLSAVVHHTPGDVVRCDNGDTNPPTCDSPTPGGTPITDHSADYITISQTGPSQ